MDTISLSATQRTERRKKVNRLRRVGTIPAVVYGHKQAPIAISVDAKVFQKTYAKSGESTLINLKVDGAGEMQTLIKEVQYHPVTDVPTHIDFQKVSLTEKLETSIPLVIVGESPAVKNLGGVIVHNATSLKVRCLPTALVHSFEVDISGLMELGSMLLVSDVVVPKDIEVLDEPELPIVSIAAPKAEEAASVPTDATAAPAEVEVLKQKTPEEQAADADKGKKDEKK